LRPSWQAPVRADRACTEESAGRSEFFGRSAQHTIDGVVKPTPAPQVRARDAEISGSPAGGKPNRWFPRSVETAAWRIGAGFAEYDETPLIWAA
jgi:hypothetical protein